MVLFVLPGVNCPSGHPTTFIIPSALASMRQGRLQCDVCACIIDKNALYGTVCTCQKCNFDLCEDCRRLPQREIDRRYEANARTRQFSQPIQECCMVAIAMHPDPVTAAARGERYNGKRPNYRGQRVSLRDYPDPTSFCWTFTGSCEGGRAEFFEKDLSSSIFTILRVQSKLFWIIPGRV